MEEHASSHDRDAVEAQIMMREMLPAGRRQIRVDQAKPHEAEASNTCNC